MVARYSSKGCEPCRESAPPPPWALSFTPGSSTLAALELAELADALTYPIAVTHAVGGR
jgi:hypothetical protein